MQRPTLENELAMTLSSAVTFSNVETTLTGEIAKITTEVVTSLRDVITLAQRLESLVVQNAARVKGEISGHVELASAIKKEAHKLQDVIEALRNTQPGAGPPPTPSTPQRQERSRANTLSL